MERTLSIKTLLIDIGGVLLTDGWDHQSRRRAAAHFDLDFAEMEDRHHLLFETHEVGNISFEEYLHRLLFYRARSFTSAQFAEFMFAQSKPYPEMIEQVAQLKQRYGLKIFVLSNEARDLNIYRIHKFKLDALVDCFVSSCFVHIRKPAADMFRLALDLAQTSAERVIYIDNTSMFVQIAESLGIRGIIHTECRATCAQLSSFGLHIDEDYRA